MNRSLGDFEQHLLFAVLRLGDHAYGARIRREIAERTGRSVSAGAVYTGLDRLAARRLVSSWQGDATPERGGRRKRFWALEPEGAAALHEAYQQIQASAEGLLADLRDLADNSTPSPGGPE